MMAWEPVNFIALADGLEIHVDEIAMTIGKGDTALATHVWPEDGNEYAICHQVPDGGVIRATPSPVGASVPVEVVQVAIECIASERNATENMMDTWKETSDTYKKYAAEIARYDAALTWLQQQRGQG